MMNLVRLLPHQAELLQAPFVFPEINFFFLVAGYASGKTSALVKAIEHTVHLLLGKKDLEAHNPKILVASKNLTFMKKTLTGLLEQDLKETNSEYSYDKAHNIITIGNVELLLIPDEDESSIYGFSCACFRDGTKIMTLTGEKNIEDITEMDHVLTRKGFKKVKHAWCNGERDCIEVNVEGTKIICTPDHRFIDSFNNEVKAQDLTKTTSLVKIDTKEWQKWLSTSGKIDESLTKSLRQTGIPQPQLAHLTAKTSSVVGRYTVYDIEVEDCHEFFANGVLVHNCAYVDELDELDTGTAMAVVKSINDRCRQQIDGFRTPFMSYTTSSQGLKGTYQTVMHFQKSGIGYVLMRARTRDNIYLPKDYVDNMYSIYNEKEIDCLLEGKFVSIDSGLVFPDYHPDVNKLDSDLYEYCRDNGHTIYIGQDFNGFGNNAVAFAILSGAIVAIKDYEFPDIRRAPEVFRYDFPENEIVWIPDMTYKEHFIEFKKELRLFNIKIAYRSCNPLVGDRNFACNKLFVAERLFVCPMCKGLETTLMTWQKDPRTGTPTKGGKGAPDHKGDCLGYVVHYLLSWKRELKPLYAVTLERLYEARKARGADATELEVSSQVMDASRLKGIVLKQAPNTIASDA